MSSFRRFAVFVAAVALTGQTRPPSQAFVPIVPRQPVVSTIAGSGALGTLDGAALRASFLEPEGIAVGPAGAIYVADAGAQEIREIRNGNVFTVAGVGGRGPSPQTRTGGYADGPVTTARFNRPVGVAVAGDGTVYVADLLNHCIRKIKDGMVSTLAGSPNAGNADGTGAAASFNLPNGIAIDDDGILYVADYGNGIRKVTPDGVVTTVIVPINKKVLAVSVRGAKDDRSLAFSDTTSIHLFQSANDGLQQYGLLATDKREPYTGYPLTVGNAYGIALLTRSTVAVTDVFTNSVRFVRFAIDTGALVRPLAGGVREGAAPDAGYRDGAPPVTLLDTPLGIAREPDGSLLFSDSGNRRIRKIEGVDPRGPVPHDHPQDLFGPAGTYRVAMIGSSIIYHDVLWPDSIPGVVEAGLARDGAQIGLKKKPFLSVIRYSGATLTGERGAIDAYFGDGGADLVVLFVSDYSMAAEFSRPEIGDGAHFARIIPSELKDLRAKLAAQGTQLLLVYLPEGEATSLTIERARGIAEINGSKEGDDLFLAQRTKALQEQSLLATSGVRLLGLQQGMEAYADSGAEPPLYYTGDDHDDRAGQTWIGNAILSDLERWKPWSVR